MATKPKHLKSCPICGHSPLEKQQQTQRFNYGPKDASVEVQAFNVPVEVCSQCGESFLGTEAAEVRHEAICDALGLLTPARILKLRQHHNKTQAEFSHLTGIGTATLSRWEKAQLIQSRALDRYLRILDALPEAMSFLEDLEANSGNNEKFRHLKANSEGYTKAKRFQLRPGNIEKKGQEQCTS